MAMASSDRLDLQEPLSNNLCSDHDFGKSLNSGAHLSALRRTKIGAFKVDEAQSIDGFIESLNVQPI